MENKETKIMNDLTFMCVEGNTCEQAFKNLNRLVLRVPDYNLKETRIGSCNEVMSAVVRINDPTTYIMKNKKINRISYDYAEDFWQFMISGGTDAEAAFKKYPGVAKFVTKPQSDELPKNFNTFYGPRIASQLPVLLKELMNNKNSRRVVFHILDVEDQKLLDLDESLEYPCTDSVTYNIRDGVLHSHVHMRSQNVAIVLQLDLYLQGRLMEYIASMTGSKVGTMTISMVSAHIFERDFEYVKTFI